MGISEIITITRDRYIKEGQAVSAYAINDGLCSDFADDVKAAMDHDPSVDVVSNEHFMGGGDFGDEGWDGELLERHWDITPPRGLSWAEVSRIPFGGHDWLSQGGRHYDAECPEGVQSFFDLPIFKRYLDEARQAG